MENRIRQITVHDRSLSPTQAEVSITLVPECRTSTTEVRGRLMGPRCPYSSTVEVAYSLRPLSSPQGSLETGGLTVRAVIPEPSLWEPQCPFLYAGPIELWQDGHRCDRAALCHGFRLLRRGEKRVLVNGRPLTLQGRRVVSCSDEAATQWHQTGYNLLIAPVAEKCLSVWETADRFGFLVLGQLGEDADEKRLAESLTSHASCLGWLSADCRAMSAEEAIGFFLADGNPEAM